VEAQAGLGHLRENKQKQGGYPIMDGPTFISATFCARLRTSCSCATTSGSFWKLAMI
jgi:hypothetical protein